MQQQDRQADDDDRFRLAMASSGIGMAIVDLDGCWVEVNPAIERMFGYRAGELVGQPVFALTHPDDVPASRGFLDELIDGRREAVDVDKRYLHRNGDTRWAHLNVAVMRGARGEPRYFISQLRDITAQRAAEQAQRELGEALERRVAERSVELQALAQQQEQIAYGLSHDLRASLRGIEGFANQLARQPLDAQGHEHLRRVRAAAAQAGTLVDALAQLSRATAVAHADAPVDISLLAIWVLAELQEAEPTRAVAIDIQPGLLVRGDERQLKRALEQLLHNAWKFSAQREAPEITVADHPAPPGRRIVCIGDNGSGFDKRYLHKLFVPFSRLHNSEQGGGHGLGLAIVHTIVQRHGGRTWAESQPGAGSRFFIELPIAESGSTP